MHSCAVDDAKMTPKDHEPVIGGPQTTTMATTDTMVQDRLRFPNEDDIYCTDNMKPLGGRHRHRTKHRLLQNVTFGTNNILSPALIFALLIFTLTPQQQQQQVPTNNLNNDDESLFSSFASSGIHHPAMIGAYAFNLDTQSPIVQQGPERSYFGYSVALHRDRNASWLLVGAPKASTNQQGTNEAGAVYRCSVTRSGTCQQIPFDTNGSSMIKLLNETKQSDSKSHQWFGASLHSANDNGSIIACAPNYVYFSTKLTRRDPVGTCWVSRGSFTGFLEYSPCRINEQWGHHHLGSCQAGFSSAITKDGSRILIGAPGSHVWQGQVFAHNLKTDLQNRTSGVNPHSEDDSYLGYSLTLGSFSSANTNDDAAIGIPRGNDLAGKVMIVDREMRTLRNITGEQMGAYFGYSLATADVNGDKLDDLIIGAPLYYNQTISHKEPHFERGRIYVVLQNMRHEFNIVARIDGRKNRARFGTSIANCGDLNRDGLQDIAVGAPYDGPNGHGAVYIFMGRRSNSGLADDPDQVIYAEQVSQDLQAFGFSLSGGMDLDGNQYPDLLVGDYKADKAVLMRTRPVVNVTTQLEFLPENFNLDEKTCLLPNSSTSVSCITVQYCVKYTGINVDNSLNFAYDIKLDTENRGEPRLFLLNREGKSEDRSTSTLTKDSRQCKSFKAYITRQIRDKLTPLKIDIDYNLIEPQDSYDNFGQLKLKPVLYKSAANKLNREAFIQKNCGPDNVCVPDLKLTMSTSNNQYTIGTGRINLDVTVRNYGEDAYESMFYLTMPMAINFLSVVNKSNANYPICYGAKPDQTGMNVLSCDLGNPMMRNEVVKFSVITEPSTREQFTEPDFTFHGLVNSTNAEDERLVGDNQETVSLVLRVDFNLMLSGDSTPTQISRDITQMSVDSEQNLRRYLVETDLGQEVIHTYQLHNRGPSTIKDTAVTILWPTRTSDGKDYLLYLVDEPLAMTHNVRCKPAEAGAINPLNLKHQEGDIQRTVSIQPVSQMTRQRIGVSSNRYKRQSAQDGQATPIKAQVTTVDDSLIAEFKQSICGTNQCNQLECNIYDLGYNETAVIKIRSRLFEETIRSFSLQNYIMRSRIVAQIKALPYNKSLDSIAPYIHTIETRLHMIGASPSIQDLPPWLLLLAILLGILLFILLACFLKYLGFFERKRPPKGAEREPLTPTMWNDYQYSPGDTAL